MKRSQRFLEKNLIRFSNTLRESLFGEEIASRAGWLQPVDPRVKVVGCFLLVGASAASHSMIVVAGLLLFALVLAAGSGIWQAPILRRLWLFIPVYTGFVALPSLFLTPGDPIPILSPPGITRQGVRTASLLVLRTTASVSFLLILILTTHWPVFLRALRYLRFPRILVLLIAMTYRYIFLLLEITIQFFLGKQSRQVGPENWRSFRQWTGMVVGSLLEKSYHWSQEVYLAMQARGFRGEPVMMQNLRIRKTDVVWFLLFVVVTFTSFYFMDLP